MIRWEHGLTFSGSRIACTVVHLQIAKVLIILQRTVFSGYFEYKNSGVLPSLHFGGQIF